MGGEKAGEDVCKHSLGEIKMNLLISLVWEGVAENIPKQKREKI